MPTPTPLPVSDIDGLKHGLWLRDTHRTEYFALTNLPWVHDRLTEAERSSAETLLGIAANDMDAYRSVINKDWVLDGIITAERDVLVLLYEIANSEPDHAAALAAMPFLDDVTNGDLEALTSILNIAYTDESTLDYIMAHFETRRGITNLMTPMVAMLYPAVTGDPPLVERLLRLPSAATSIRYFDLPLAGRTRFAIVDAYGGVRANAINLLYRAAQLNETLLRRPLPTTSVNLLFADTSAAGFSGTNYSTAIVMDYDYQKESNYQYEYLPAALVHEVAHYYWSGNADWVDEGMAEFTELTYRNRQDNRPLFPDRYPCAEIETIKELAESPPRRSDYHRFLCNYTLGQRAFIELYQEAGPRRFWDAAGNLYDASLAPGVSLGAYHIRQSFADYFTTFAIYYVGGRTTRYQPPADFTSQIPYTDILVLNQGLSDGEYNTVSDPFSTRHQGQMYLKLKFWYPYLTQTTTRTITVTEYGPDNMPYRIREYEVELDYDYYSSTHLYPIGPVGNQSWQTGYHWLTVTSGGEVITADIFRVYEIYTAPP